MNLKNPVEEAAYEAGWRDCEHAIPRLVRDAITPTKLKRALAIAKAQRLFGPNGEAPAALAPAARQ